jgi:hypothetical protein
VRQFALRFLTLAMLVSLYVMNPIAGVVAVAGGYGYALGYRRVRLFRLTIG